MGISRLLLHPQGVIRRKIGELSSLVGRVHQTERIKRIHEADMWKRFIIPGPLIVGVFNVETWRCSKGVASPHCSGVPHGISEAIAAPESPA